MNELEQLRAWKREAMTRFDGLQDLGRALDLPLGALVTGPLAVEAANRMRERLAAAEALADEWEREADIICPRGEYDKADKAWRVALVRRRAASDLRAALASDPTHAQDGAWVGEREARHTAENGLPVGIDLIRAERQRQIDAEGWTPEHDAAHGPSRLMRAAEAYEFDDRTLWPWDRELWKPKDALSNLIRAGALYQAAVDVGPLFTGAPKSGVTRCAAKIDATLARAHAILTRVIPPGVDQDGGRG